MAEEKVAHTPGPWTYREAKGAACGGEVGYEVVSGGVVVAKVVHPLFGNEIPNARLIAAAPEMLAWIREVVGHDMPGYKTRMERGRTLLAKVEGS